MARSFVPGSDNTRDFRDALGCFATGVTVVTAPGKPAGIGMTANSFSSISLAPPLVLWSPSKTSLRYPFFASAKRFAIHVMRANQLDLAMDFARRGDAFDRVETRYDDDGLPLIEDCLARFECHTNALHDGGDHAIMVGHVENVLLNEGKPLVFAQSAYGAFSPDA